jgi:DNA-binding transcriptional LysR family regulator
LVLVTPDAHPLAARASLAFDETLAFDHVTMRRDSSSNNLLLQAAIAARRHIRMRFQVTSFDAMIAMIKAGLASASCRWARLPTMPATDWRSSTWKTAGRVGN